MDGTRIFRLIPSSARPTLIKNAVKYSSLGKGSVPLDIAKLVVFLSSTLSSAHNGQELYGDQGASIPLL